MFGTKLGVCVGSLVCLFGGLNPVWAQGSGKGGVSVPSNSGGRREQPTPTPPKPAAAPKSAPAAGVVSFAEDKFHLDSVGLSISLPEGATAQSTTIGGRATVQIIPKESNWILNIQTPRTTNPEASIVEATEKTIALLQGSVGVVDPDQKTVLNTEAKLLGRNDDLVLEAGKCSRFYISLPNTDKSRLVKGYTVFKPTPQQYVIFELITAEPEFAKVKPVYEAVLATASFADGEAVMTERGVFVKAGQAFFSGLSEADYVQAMPEGKVWQRFFNPHKGSGSAMDAEELGYSGVRFWRGKRGELDPSKPIGSYSKLEQEEGYLCSIESRRAVEKQWADTRQICFMKPDRSAEAWSLKMVVRDATGKETAVGTETGARDGTNLTIVTSEPKRPLETIAPPVPDGYISQFERFLLPRLLVRKKVQTAVGCYVWMPNKSVCFRKDDVSRETSGKNALWTIATVFRDEDATQTYTYNDKGDLVRGEISKVGQTEPMELTQLLRLWEQKGLPTSKLATDK